MSRTKPRKLFLLAVSACLIWAAAVGRADAVTILGSQAWSLTSPTFSGTGLDGKFYSLSPYTSSLSSLSQADGFVAAHPTPTATFTATSLCLPSCNTSVADTTTVATYLAGAATNVVGTTTGNIAISETRFSGYIAITAGTHSFTLSSDDGSSLQIGGTSIISNDGIHALGGSTASVIFNSTGVYSIFAEYFENSGQTGFTLQMDGTQIATSSLYSAQVLPEPGTLGLFAVGLLGLHKARRWRRTACR